MPTTNLGIQQEYLQTLNEISRVVSATLDLHTLYDTMYRQISRVMDTTVFYLALHQEERDIIEVPYYQEEGDLFVHQEFPYGGSVTSLVIDRASHLLFEMHSDYQKYARTNGLPEILIGDASKDQSQSQMFVPLNTGSRTIGALSVQSKHAGVYTEDDMQTLSIIASQAAIAIENARLFSEQQRRVTELQTIQNIVHKLGSLHDVPAIAAVINDELKHLIDYHSCRIFALDPHQQTLCPIMFAGVEDREFGLRLGEGFGGWVALHNQPAVIGNTLHDERGVQLPGTPVREESMIGAPLSYEGSVRGVITLSKLGINQFDESDLRLLEIIAAQAALAFDRTRLYEELRTEAATDELTKLYNRRHLMQRFKEQAARARRDGQALAVILLDVDKFKHVNDRFGHDAGDAVLEDLAVVVRAVVRVEDIVARYGGEEFCVVLPIRSIDEALGVAERLRAAIARRRLPAAMGVQGVTVSVGLAQLATDDVGTEAFTRADQAMYRAKHAGGNRLCLWNEVMGSPSRSGVHPAENCGLPSAGYGM